MGPAFPSGTMRSAGRIGQCRFRGTVAHIVTNGFMRIRGNSRLAFAGYLILVAKSILTVASMGAGHSRSVSPGRRISWAWYRAHQAARGPGPQSDARGPVSS